jgi:hypothetical protein
MTHNPNANVESPEQIDWTAFSIEDLERIVKGVTNGLEKSRHRLNDAEVKTMQQLIDGASGELDRREGEAQAKLAGEL